MAQTKANKTTEMSGYKRGRWAEFLARAYLRLCGYRVLYKNYITGRGTTAGEVDFVACKGKCLAFVEVKCRQSLDIAAYAIKPRQQQRIVNAARFFLQNHPQYNDYNVRFDAVLVRLPLKIVHLKDAWQEKA